jgi:hypothetical protein
VPAASAISAFQCLSVDNTNCHLILSGNGDLSMGTGAIAVSTHRAHFSKASTNNNFSTMRQIAIGVDGNSAYNLSLGYGFSGASFSGVIQPYDNSVASQLLLNPVGGNVGIFDATPDAKLDVNGVAMATGFLPGKYTSKPCATFSLPEGTIFYNDTSNYMCFCNGVGNNGVQMAAPALQCF